MPPEPVFFRSATCSIAAALEVVGEKWSLLVLREAFRGVGRFDDILEGVGCARSILTARLASLVENDILARVPYQDGGARLRYEYVLSPKGLEIYPVLIALMQWGDKWHPPTGEPAVVIRHRGCRADVRAELRCSKGHGPLAAEETYARPGPGADLAVLGQR